MRPPNVRLLGWLLAAFVFLLVLQELQKGPSSTEQPENRISVTNQTLIFDGAYKDFDPAASKWRDVEGLQSNSTLSWQGLERARALARIQAESILATKWISTGPRTTRNIENAGLLSGYGTVAQLDNIAETPVSLPFYQNISGAIRGSWFRSGTSILDYSSVAQLNKTYTSSSLDANITGWSGLSHLNLVEEQGWVSSNKYRAVRKIKADLSIEDTSGAEWDLPLRGLHFVNSGAVLLVTTSKKFDGIKALPQLARTEEQFNQIREWQNSTAVKAVEHADDLVDVWAREEYDVEEESILPPKCEYIVYLQQHLVWPWLTDADMYQKKPESHIHTIEQELRYSTGLHLHYIPRLQFSATIYSPDCGFVLETKHPDSLVTSSANALVGYKREILQANLKRDVLLYTVVILCQVLLLMRQKKDSSTPSTRSRISYSTIAIMTMADQGIMTTALALSAAVKNASIQFSAATFFLLLCVPIFGIKFLLDIWSAQAPERRDQERQRVARLQEDSISSTNTSTTTTSAIITPAGADLLPLPVTTNRQSNAGPTTVILPPDQDTDVTVMEDDLLHGTAASNPSNSSQRSNLGLRLIFFSFSFTMICYISLFWPPALRRFFANAVIFGYLSFWLPQIRRNMLRNCRKALRYEFVIGQSVLRLYPIAYFYVYENAFYLRTSPYTFGLFAAYQWAQILMLWSQDILGPRFFLPSGILPDAYDYHQNLHEGDEDGGGFMPIGSTQHVSTGESKGKGKWTSDCSICMHSMEAPYVTRGAVPKGQKTVSNVFARRDYMITPCRHIFHTHCLDGWMKYKLQCPICREVLPPV